MGLTGIQIFKLLPKTICGECGVPTCLAFAMNLASGKAELDACPYVSDEAREQLKLDAPPVQDTSWGSRIFRVMDPDGIPITFLQWTEAQRAAS